MKTKTIERNFRKIKNGFNQLEQIVKHTKVGALWDSEANIRKKLKELKEYKNENLKDYDSVKEEYLDLLQYISKKLIDNYNDKNGTEYNFYDIVQDNYEGYLKSGIMSILITEHIPEMVTAMFDEIFPDNPKNEYVDARKYKRKIFLHLGDTNTGKTYNAMMNLKKASTGIYLSPLRILALENFERLNNAGVKCNLITGEEEIIIEGAAHISCTIEKLNITKTYEVAVIDEIQMIGDEQRGAAWTRALLGLKCKEIHICGALNTRELLEEIIEDCADEYEVLEYKRDIPLKLENSAFSYRDAQVGDALVVFSKKRVLELAQYYSNLGIKVSLIYGDLPPEVRKKQYELFTSGENSVLISTDAIGMGVNLPIKRIVFMEIKKFDGTEIRHLTSQEVKQIAGRAGRKGIYEVGYVASFGAKQDFLRENLEVLDSPIEKAIVAPSEEILKIKNLPLREKIALWSTREEKLPYYSKMDISELLVILDSIKGYKLNEKIQWQLLKIPFDIANQDLFNTFLNNIDQLFIVKDKFLNKPNCIIRELRELETYYQKINMYYSFSKAFNLEFDETWVYEERIKVGEEINSILLNI